MVRKIFIFVFIILFLTFLGIKIIVPVDVSGTLSTSYERIEDSDLKLIQTKHFSFKAPKQWYHIFCGYGQHGAPYGLFVTPNGVMDYEYGFYSCGYDSSSFYNTDYTFQTIEEKDFKIFIARDPDNNESGISMIKGDSYSFCFFMSETVSENEEHLINSMKSADLLLSNRLK